MELDLSTQFDYCLRKHLFNLKTHRSDGLILQVHHSYSDAGRENKRYRFIFASFNDCGMLLAAADHKGHVFIIDLETERYWLLPQVGLPTVISFPVLKKQELLLGLENTSVIFMNVETGNVINNLLGHTIPATDVSYSDDGHYYLTSNISEAIVWDSSTGTQIHRLSLKLEASLKKVLFMPVTNHILACFRDDTMHIWKFENFECIKQVIPETWKTHHLTSIAITKNGRAMVIGGHSPNLVVFCLDTWSVKRVVEFPVNISGVKQMEFISQVFDGGANKILLLLTTSHEIYFLDVETSVFLKGLGQMFGQAVKFSLSSNGKYLGSILRTGEVNIYIIEKVLGDNKYRSDSEEGLRFSQSLTNRNYSRSSRRTQKSSESLGSIQKQISEVLDVKKLVPILKQFGEYPESYRMLIWKTILQIPENQECFVSLTLKKCHPSYSTLESKYPLANKSLSSALKKLLSNLSHWCPLFGEVDFLPEFVFPFVKLYHTNPLLCFEVVATIIVNWCQNWFEFYPFPPINMLSQLESILGYHDPDLLEFYLKNNVTSSVFVCPLFHTAFSEVLSKTEWMRLWDHVLSNEISFLFMTVVAFNVVCRNTLKSLQNAEEIEKFFHTQTPIDMKTLITKSYFYLKQTPEHIHIRQFFNSFRPLGSGGAYTCFLAYPKLIVDSSVEKLQSIREEESRILDEQFKALSVKKELEEKLKPDYKAEDQQRLYRELEERIRKTVEEEEDRILTQRQKLQNLRQELRLKELEVLESTWDRALKEKLERKELEFERLLRDISKKKAREKLEVDNVEKEIRNYYSDLQLRKCQLEIELGLNDGGGDTGKDLEEQREKLKKDIIELQDEWESSHHSKRIEIYNKMAAIKDLIQDVEMELMKEAAEKNPERELDGNRVFVEELKEKVKSLEDEIEKLIQENLNKLRSQRKTVTTTKFQPISISKNTSDSKNDTKMPESSKCRKTIKCVTRKTSPGLRSNVRKITMIRARVPVSKSGQCRGEKLKKGTTEKNSHDYTTDCSPDLKNFPRQAPEDKSTAPERKDCSNLNECDSCQMKYFHQQPKGDCDRDTKEWHSDNKNKRRGNISKFTIKKGGSSENCSDENDIFKTALRTRKQLIEDAKRKHFFQ